MSNKKEITEELKNQVIRAYTEKKMGLSVISNAGICSQKVAKSILEEEGIELRSNGRIWKEQEDKKFENRRYG